MLVAVGIGVLMQCFRCQDKKGTFMAETTAWEGTAARASTQAELGPQEHSLKALSQAAANKQ
jgi:hypothetical protein